MLLKCMAIFVQLYCGSCEFYTISDTIRADDNLTFVPGIVTSRNKSTTLSIQFNISFPAEQCCPVLYYTINDFVGDRLDLQNKQCFNDTFEAAKFTDRALWWFYPGSRDGETLCNETQGYIYCTFAFEILVGYEAIANFSVGYPCSDVKQLDLNYIFTFESDLPSECSRFGDNAYHKLCRSFDYDFYSSLKYIPIKSILDYYLAQSAIDNLQTNCYQHAYLFACLVFAPKCNSHTIFPPCKRLCLDYIDACGHLPMGGIEVGCTPFPDSVDPEVCVYQSVECANLTLPSGNITYSEEIHGYPVAGVRASFQCDDGYELSTSVVLRCMFNGLWNYPTPACKPIQINAPNSKKVTIAPMLLGIGAGVVVTILVSVTSAVIWKKYRCFRALKTTHYNGFHAQNGVANVNNNTTKQFDMFLIYSSEDYHIVKHEIAVPFEENTSYQLCIADRDFHAGRLIVQNIQNALSKSRGVIMAVSQNFVDSEWCKYEFFQAYHKAIEETNFHLILVLLQSFESLNNIPPLLGDYYNSYTCISIDEPGFVEKLKTIISSQLRLPLSELTQFEHGHECRDDVTV